MIIRAVGTIRKRIRANVGHGEAGIASRIAISDNKICRVASVGRRGLIIWHTIGARGIFVVDAQVGIKISRFVPLVLAGEKPTGAGVARYGVEFGDSQSAIERVRAVFRGVAILWTTRLTVMKPVGKPYCVTPTHVHHRFVAVGIGNGATVDRGGFHGVGEAAE